MAKHPHHHRDQNRDCYRCPPGFGVERPCSHFHDTECGACAPDHYSSHKSSWRPCYPCSRCGAGLYVAHRCTAKRDTVCDSCHTYRGPHNEDFYERCVRPLLDSAANDTRSVHSQSSQAKEDIRARSFSTESVASLKKGGIISLSSLKLAPDNLSSINSSIGYFGTDLVILSRDQMTRATPGLASPSPSFHATPTGGRLATTYDLAYDRPGEAGFEPGTLWPQSRDLTTKPPRPFFGTGENDV
ncbi:hypothetical protein AVEN_209551-1 [Araneus ventricosus]|uniref:TNFR-Cys domain-containing protein n=1 Tax=Araneus ventricosus TaxID=182803 RepID=A0A4Y2PDR9_ARAVE|nr:hypothetical protein AVEN_209551-1 [Araneus ventricosus]